MDYGNEEQYGPRNRHKAKGATYGKFWCAVCDYDFLGEVGRCRICGAKGKEGRIKYERKRSSFNP